MLSHLPTDLEKLIIDKTYELKIYELKQKLHKELLNINQNGITLNNYLVRIIPELINYTGIFKRIDSLYPFCAYVPFYIIYQNKGLIN